MRRRPTDSESTEESLHVSHAVQELGDALAQVALLLEGLHSVEAALDRSRVAQGKQEPVRNRARAHGGTTAVEMPDDGSPSAFRGSRDCGVSTRPASRNRWVCKHEAASGV